MTVADGYWVDTSFKGRIKEFFKEGFNTLKNNKRIVAYATAAVGSGITGYALTGSPTGAAIGLDCFLIPVQVRTAYSANRMHKEYKKRTDELKKRIDVKRN